jgi:hypothetical protein
MHTHTTEITEVTCTRNKLVTSCVMVSVLAIGPKVRRFKPSEGERFLRVTEIQHAFLWRGSKTISTML